MAGLWIILLCLIYISGKKYRDHAVLLLKKQLDERLRTEIIIRKNDIHVSFFRKFPYAVVNLDNILIKSAPDFTKSDFTIPGSDTLLFAEKIYLIFNLKSLFSKKFILKKFEIHNALMNVLHDKEGRSNYNILKKTGPENSDDTIHIDLRDIQIRNLHFYYQDRKNNITTSCEIRKSQLAGSFIESDFHIKTRIEVINTCLEFKNNRILQHQNLLLTTDLQKKESVYNFSEGIITLFGIHMNALGTYDGAGGDYNFVFTCSRAPFQKLDNDLFMRYIEDMAIKPTGGELNIRFNISRRKTYQPHIRIDFLLHEGVIKHKESGIRAGNIFLRGSFTNGQERNARSSTLDIDSMYVTSGESKLYISGSITNFNSPSINGRIRGILEMDKLRIIKSLEKKYKLSGSLKSDINIHGTLPGIKNLKTGDLKKCTLKGFLLLDEVSLESLDNAFPPCIISGKIILKNLSEFNFENINIKAGESDLLLNGDIISLPFFATDRQQFPIVTCRVRSTEFHVEDFLFHSEEKVSDSAKIIFPDSIIVHADISLSSFTYGKFHATDVSGNVLYQPKTMEINDFTMQSQGGTILSSLSITQTGNVITSNCKASLKQVDIGDLFHAFNEFGQTVITHEYLNGTLTGNADVIASWDVFLNPLYSKLQVQSDFNIENGELINYQPLLGLSDFIKVEELRHIQFENLHANIHVADEKVTLAQTQINSSAISLTGSGEHDFKNNYSYRIQVYLADVLWKKAKKKKPENTEFGYVVDDGDGRTILPLVISGKDTVFTVNYDQKTASTIFRDKILKEREEWKELISPDTSTHSHKQNFKLVWEEDSAGHEIYKPDEESEKEEEFKVEWDDE